MYNTVPRSESYLQYSKRHASKYTKSNTVSSPKRTHLFSPQAIMAALPPVPAPVGVFPQFFAAGPETIVLKEKVLSLTGDSFSIKLANGTCVIPITFKVRSKAGC